MLTAKRELILLTEAWQREKQHAGRWRETRDGGRQIAIWNRCAFLEISNRNTRLTEWNEEIIFYVVMLDDYSFPNPFDRVDQPNLT